MTDEQLQHTTTFKVIPSGTGEVDPAPDTRTFKFAAAGVGVVTPKPSPSTSEA